MNDGSIFSSINEMLYSYAKRHMFLPRNNSVEIPIEHDITLCYPRNRNVYVGADVPYKNVFESWAEILWILGGDEYISPVMSAFNPSLLENAEDGKTLRSAYNKRIRKYNLLEHVIQMYKIYGMNTANACFSIWNPEFDCIDSIKSTRDTKTIEMPFASFVWTHIRNDSFNFKLGMERSRIIEDVNEIVAFTVIHELLYEYLKRDLYPSLQLGMFVYSPFAVVTEKKTIPFIVDIAEYGNEMLAQCSNDEANYKIKIPEAMDIYEFTGKLYRTFEHWVRFILENKSTLNIEAVKEEIDKFFDNAKCDRQFNTLYLYTILPLLYLYFNKLKNSDDQGNFIDFINFSDIVFSIDIKKTLELRNGLYL